MSGFYLNAEKVRHTLMFSRDHELFLPTDFIDEISVMSALKSVHYVTDRNQINMIILG